MNSTTGYTPRFLVSLAVTFAILTPSLAMASDDDDANAAEQHAAASTSSYEARKLGLSLSLGGQSRSSVFDLFGMGVRRASAEYEIFRPKESAPGLVLAGFAGVGFVRDSDMIEVPEGASAPLLSERYWHVDFGARVGYRSEEQLRASRVGFGAALEYSMEPIEYHYVYKEPTEVLHDLRRLTPSIYAEILAGPLQVRPSLGVVAHTSYREDVGRDRGEPYGEPGERRARFGSSVAVLGLDVGYRF